jgi:predicted Zn-dependent protease
MIMRLQVGAVSFLILFLASSVYAESPMVRAHQMIHTVSGDDITAEIELGREIAARIIGKYSLYEDDALTRYVNLVGKSLARHVNRPELPFTMGILDTDAVNAFAAPGGYIFITKGAIDRMEDESELAAVIAHEIIHVTQKHIVKELNIQASAGSPASGLAGLIGGTSQSARVAFTKAADETLEFLLNRGYRKMDEIEADTMGVALASSSLGYDPMALVRYLEKIEVLSGEEASRFRSLYPPFKERIAGIQSVIEEEGLAHGDFKRGRERFQAYPHEKR